MLELPQRLSPSALAAVADLEGEVVNADGGRIKLEWEHLTAGDKVQPILWWEDGELTGFCGLYTFSPRAVEIAGMVRPGNRRRGVGGCLLDAAVKGCRRLGSSRALLIVPRPSVGGRRLAEKRGAALDHSEHALVLDGPPAPAAGHDGVALRPGTMDDEKELSRLLEVAFGYPVDGVAGRLGAGDERESTLVITLDGEVVGTLAASLFDGEGGVYGFAVDPAFQGRGVGRAALTQACTHLRERGARRVRLEVEVGNDNALGLYTSVGFQPVITEDYWALPDVGRREPGSESGGR
jgi:ribosomal protein S18 acetylase RimI-like enzyme